MAGGLIHFLKRWRDNYYLSALLAYFTRPLYRASGFLTRQIQQKVHKNGVTIRLPNGKKMIIGKNAGVGMASLLFWHGLDGYEPQTSKTLRFLFERATTFIDIGANYGLYSVMGALWNPGLRVVAFEPVSAIFEGLSRNVRLNRLEDRVRCENVALSSISGPGVLFLPLHEGLDQESTGTLVSQSWQSRQGARKVGVETIRFDEYESRHPMCVDLVKIDVEDFEADVLEGMRSVITRDRPFIVCEVLPRDHRNERTLSVVESLQYQPYWITPVGYIRVSTFDFVRGNYTDFLLSPVSTPETVLDSLAGLVRLKFGSLNTRH